MRAPPCCNPARPASCAWKSASPRREHPAALATALGGALRGAGAAEALAGVPEPGRALLVSCPRTLPGNAEGCTAGVDPRGAGLALGSTDR